jgi:hypothetical protein
MFNEVSLIRVVILRNELEKDHLHWVDSCNKATDQLLYEVIDLTKNDWLDKIAAFSPDLLLTKPGGLTTPFKQLYDERLMILVRELGYKSFPTLDEVLIYENKRYFSYWLKAHQIPHPETHIFYFREEASEYIKSCAFPLAAKVNIGASGSGVSILSNREQALKYISGTFTGRGAAKRKGPDLKKRSLFKRGFRYVLHPGEVIARIRIYRSRGKDMQNSFVLLQKFVKHNFEWRVVRIGDSFFAHKKLNRGDKASGSLIKDYGNPPLEIFDFVKELTDRFGFFSQAVDLFETDNGLLVNEMQCIFGQSDPFQMMVDNKPGRYIHKNDQWIFEEGDFNANESYDLRLQAAIDIFKDKRI